MQIDCFAFTSNKQAKIEINQFYYNSIKIIRNSKFNKSTLKNMKHF